MQQRPEAGHLGVIDGPELFRRLVFQPPVGDHAGTVNKSLDRSDLRANFSDQGSDGSPVPDVRLTVMYGGPGLAEVVQIMANLTGNHDTTVLVIKVTRR